MQLPAGGGNATLAKHQAEQAGRAEDERTDEPGAATSMRYGFEALAQGSLFSVGFTLRNPTDVELGVFFGGLGYFYARPKIGGRGARGFGTVRRWEVTPTTEDRSVIAPDGAIMRPIPAALLSRLDRTGPDLQYAYTTYRPPYHAPQYAAPCSVAGRLKSWFPALG